MTLTPFLFLLLGLNASVAPDDPCDPEELVKPCKKELHPYSYSNSRSIIAQDDASREISVTLLENEEYRLVFNMRKLPDDAVIRIYDGPKEESGRDLLKSSRDIPGGRSVFIYDPINESGEDIYISYQIPDTEERSCFAFVVGYKLSFD